MELGTRLGCSQKYSVCPSKVEYTGQVALSSGNHGLSLDATSATAIARNHGTRSSLVGVDSAEDAYGSLKFVTSSEIYTAETRPAAIQKVQAIIHRLQQELAQVGG
jgi:hypothetical protein